MSMSLDRAERTFPTISGRVEWNVDASRVTPSTSSSNTMSAWFRPVWGRDWMPLSILTTIAGCWVGGGGLVGKAGERVPRERHGDRRLVSGGATSSLPEEQATASAVRGTERRPPPDGGPADGRSQESQRFDAQVERRDGAPCRARPRRGRRSRGAPIRGGPARRWSRCAASGPGAAQAGRVAGEGDRCPVQEQVAIGVGEVGVAGGDGPAEGPHRDGARTSSAPRPIAGRATVVTATEAAASSPWRTRANAQATTPSSSTRSRASSSPGSRPSPGWPTAHRRRACWPRPRRPRRGRAPARRWWRTGRRPG